MSGREIEGCKDPIDAILRQDKAFGPVEIDMDLWLKTHHYPAVVVTSEFSRVFNDAEMTRRNLSKMDAIARAEGTVALKTRILSHLQPTEDTAIVCSIRDRLDAAGNIIASVSLTWVLMREDENWKIRTTHVDDGAHSESAMTWIMRNEGDDE